MSLLMAEVKEFQKKSSSANGRSPSEVLDSWTIGLLAVVGIRCEPPVLLVVCVLAGLMAAKPILGASTSGVRP